MNSYHNKTVLTAGVYDLLHKGHINLFYNAKQLGTRLVVAVQKSEFVKEFKPNAKLYYSDEERIFLVSSIRYVDSVIQYSSVDKLVTEVDFDIFAIGPDQTNSAFKKAIKWCKENNKAVVIIPRTEGISSSYLRTLE